MKYFHKNVKKAEELTYLSRIEKIHPHKMISYLAMFGSILIIAFLLLSFHFSKPAESNIALQFELPKLFFINTFVLLISAFILSKAKKHYAEDDATSMRKTIALTMSASFLFLFLQLITIMQLLGNDLFMAGEIIKSYMIFLLTFHFILLTAGLTMCAITFTKYRKIEKDPVSSLIIFTNPYEKVRVSVLSEYWYFISLAWVAIYTFLHFSF